MPRNKGKVKTRRMSLRRKKRQRREKTGTVTTAVQETRRKAQRRRISRIQVRTLTHFFNVLLFQIFPTTNEFHTISNKGLKQCGWHCLPRWQKERYPNSK